MNDSLSFNNIVEEANPIYHLAYTFTQKSVAVIDISCNYVSTQIEHKRFIVLLMLFSYLHKFMAPFDYKKLIVC